MKLIIQSVAAAIAVALASTSAHAALSNQLGTAAPPGNGLIVAVYDTNDSHSEVVALSSSTTNLYTDLTLAALDPSAPTSLFTLQANPTGAAGQVLQLDFGVLPSFAATFGGSSTVSYLVGVAGSTSTIDVTSSTTFTNSSALVSTITTGITSEISDWINDTTVSGQGNIIDLTGTKNWNAAVAGIGCTICAGGLGSVLNFGGSIDSALPFYQLTGPSRGTPTMTAFAGFWFLNSSGDLTYNVPQAVPLPAALWLLGSGLAGLGVIGRRRRTVTPA